MPTERPIFGENLSGILEARGFTQSAFAKAVGTSQGVISSVIRGNRFPNLDAIETWADTLSLVGISRLIFIDLACVAHVPDPHQRRLAQMIHEFHFMPEREKDLREQFEIMQSAIRKLADRRIGYKP